MLVRFSSTETESIVMFHDIAVQLLKMMGATGVIPGALRAADIPAAIQRLRERLQADAAAVTTSEPTARQHNDMRDREPVVALSTRATPLIDLLQRAAARDATVMWEKA
jgi:hypothetical protein